MLTALYTEIRLGGLKCKGHKPRSLIGFVQIESGGNSNAEPVRLLFFQNRGIGPAYFVCRVTAICLLYQLVGDGRRAPQMISALLCAFAPEHQGQDPGTKSEQRVS